MRFHDYEAMVLEAGKRVLNGENKLDVVDEYIAKHPTTHRRAFKKQVEMVVKKNGDWYLGSYRL